MAHVFLIFCSPLNLCRVLDVLVSFYPLTPPTSSPLVIILLVSRPFLRMCPSTESTQHPYSHCLIVSCVQCSLPLYKDDCLTSSFCLSRVILPYPKNNFVMNTTTGGSVATREATRPTQRRLFPDSKFQGGLCFCVHR